MEQNTNDNRMLNEEELEQVNGGGLGAAPVYYNENGACEWCGSREFIFEPNFAKRCVGCDIPYWIRRKDFTEEQLEGMREEVRKAGRTPIF